MLLFLLLEGTCSLFAKLFNFDDILSKPLRFYVSRFYVAEESKA